MTGSITGRHLAGSGLHSYWNTVLDAVHECPKGLADYNPDSILCFWQNVYHYPPLVILAESLPWLYFKYKDSLEAKPDTAWQEMEHLSFSVLFLTENLRFL